MTGPLTLSEEERIEAALEAAKKAMPGPWERRLYEHGGSKIFNGNNLIAITFEPKGNADLLFASPLLAAEVVRLRALLTRNQAPEFCEWKASGEGWATSCGKMVYAHSDDVVTPFCAYCGRRIKEKT